MILKRKRRKPRQSKPGGLAAQEIFFGEYDAGDGGKDTESEGIKFLHPVPEYIPADP